MSTIHPIHPTLQFEAKHAMRFLDNLLQLFCPVMKRNIGILFLGGRGHLGGALPPAPWSFLDIAQTGIDRAAERPRFHPPAWSTPPAASSRRGG